MWTSVSPWAKFSSRVDVEVVAPENVLVGDEAARSEVARIARERGVAGVDRVDRHVATDDPITMTAAVCSGR